MNVAIRTILSPLSLELKRQSPLFSCANTHDLLKGADKNLAIAYFARACCLHDKLNHLLGQLGLYRHLKFYFGQEINHILGATVKLSMSFLSSKAFDLGDGDAVNLMLNKRLAHFVELEWLDNRGN